MVSDFDDGDKVGGGGDLVPQNPAPQGNSPFDQYRHVRSDGTEYWSARDIQIPFGYGAWREFEKVVLSAAEDFMNLLGNADDHFARTHKMVPIGSGASRRVVDYELSRYACYLTAMRCNTEEGSFARAYFAARTRRDELRLPPAGTQTRQVPRPWSERLNRSIMEHRCYIVKNLPKGAFSVYTGTIPDILTMEDVLLDHLLPLLLSDGPDISMGKRWPKYREGKPWAGTVLSAPLFMPAQGIDVPVYVYLVREWPYFREWLEAIYLPEHLPEYLCRKFSKKNYGLAPPSAADNTCKKLTGTPAKLSASVRRQLVAAGGIIRVGYQPPDDPRQLELF